jgi:hypothetical protein
MLCMCCVNECFCILGFVYDHFVYHDVHVLHFYRGRLSFLLENFENLDNYQLAKMIEWRILVVGSTEEGKDCGSC